MTDRDKGRWDERFPPVADGEDAKPFGDRLGAADVTIWRAAEARLLAKRIGELAGPGRPFAYGGRRDAAARHHPHGRLRARAGGARHPHLRAGRARLLGQQQVADLRAYLAALANPLDELALYSVLASPLGGLSLDALVVLATPAASARARGGDLAGA